MSIEGGGIALWERLEERARFHDERDQGAEDMVTAHVLQEAATFVRDAYALGLMVEEFSEVGQLVGKAMRFGLDTPGPTGKTARDMLPAEMGDASAAIDFAGLDGIAPFTAIIGARETKKRKLLDPESRDAQGHRLAPPPRGRRTPPL